MPIKSHNIYILSYTIGLLFFKLKLRFAFYTLYVILR